MMLSKCTRDCTLPPLKDCVGFPGGAYAIGDIEPINVSIDLMFDYSWIVPPVAIHGYSEIVFAACFHEPCEKGF